MTNPISLAQDVIKEINEYRDKLTSFLPFYLDIDKMTYDHFLNYIDEYISDGYINLVICYWKDYNCLKSKALGLLSAFINEKEFLIEYYHGRELDGKLNSRLEGLRQAIDLLNKNGVKI